MKRQTHIEVTYRRGKAFAAYIYLPAETTQEVATTRELRPGIVADFDRDGNVLGVEIVHPGHTSRGQILEVLRELRVTGVTEEELAPIG